MAAGIAGQSNENVSDHEINCRHKALKAMLPDAQGSCGVCDNAACTLPPMVPYHSAEDPDVRTLANAFSQPAVCSCTVTTR